MRAVAELISLCWKMCHVCLAADGDLAALAAVNSDEPAAAALLEILFRRILEHKNRLPRTKRG